MAIKINIQTFGLPAVVAGIKAMEGGLPGRMDHVVRREANGILFDSQNVVPFVPEDTGALRSTGRVEKIKVSSFTTGYQVTYGGWSDSTGTFVDYAEIVHEELRFRNWKLPGSGPKFVSTHADRRMEQLERDGLAADINEWANGLF